MIFITNIGYTEVLTKTRGILYLELFRMFSIVNCYVNCPTVQNL